MPSQPPALPSSQDRECLSSMMAWNPSVLEITFGVGGSASWPCPGCAAPSRPSASTLQPFPLVARTDLVMPDGSGLNGALPRQGAQRGGGGLAVMPRTPPSRRPSTRCGGAYDFLTLALLAGRDRRHRAEGARRARSSPRTSSSRPTSSGSRRSARIHWARACDGPHPAKALDKIAGMRHGADHHGESGTGRSVARLLHDKSDRVGRPFVVVNCGPSRGADGGELWPREGAFSPGASGRFCSACSARPTAAPCCSTRWASPAS